VKNCVLAFGSHADDHEGTSGPLLMKLAERGWEAREVMGTCNHAGIRGDFTPREVWETRTREAKEAALVLGVEVIWLDLKQATAGARDRTGKLQWTSVDPEAEDLPATCRGHLPITVACQDDAEIDRVAELLVEHEPGLITTHVINDLGTEHHALTALVVQAWDRASKEVELGPVYMWIRSGPSVTVKIPADTIVDISPYAERAIEAISKHVSQGYGAPDRWEWIRRMYRYWGSFIGVEYAMGYKLLRGMHAAL